MEKSLNELAEEILDEIEKEDFIYALKHYGGYKVKTTAKKIRKKMEEI